MQLTASQITKRLSGAREDRPRAQRSSGAEARLQRARGEIESQLPALCPEYADFTSVVRRFAGSRFAAASREIIGIAGSRVGEGKTTVALTLAAALAEMHQRVVYVEADNSDTQTLLQQLGEPQRAGLSDWLASQASLSEILYQTARPHLYAVPFGQAQLPQGSLQTLAPLNTLVSALRAGFDIVLIDLPPLLSHEAAPAMLRQLDCAVIVAAANQTKLHDMERVVQLCEDVPVAGILLNKVSNSAPSWLRALLAPAIKRETA